MPNQIGNSGMSALDANQVIRKSGLTLADGSVAQQVITANSLVKESYNELDLTYVPSGNGVGEIQTVVYKQAGVTVATLTLSYNGSNKLSSVVRS